MAKLRLPQHMVFHHDLHLIVFHPRGRLTEKRILQDIAYLEAAEDESKHPFNRFTDTTNSDLSEITFNQILRISLHRRLKYGTGPKVKSAFYVTHSDAMRIIKVHALMTGHSPLQVRIFEQLDAAAKWLGVSVEDLQMGSKR